MPDLANASAAVVLVRALVSAWNAHDTERIVALYTEACTGEDVVLPRPYQGRATLRRLITSYLAAFPDLQLRAERVLEQGGSVVLLWTMAGTHRGPVLHIPATGRRVAVRGVTILDLEGGRIGHSTRVWDVAGLLRSLGLLPHLR